MLVPVLSAYDPQETADGSIDPLGLYPIADHLAVRLVPGVRERQQHPRFLTTIAVSLALCSEFPEDAGAADGVSEPWQVFEWHVVARLPREQIRFFSDFRSSTFAIDFTRWFLVPVLP